jgi:hypothetical protein
VFREVSAGLKELHEEFGNLNKWLQLLEDSADNLQRQAQQQRRMHDRMQSSLDDKMSRIQQLLESFEEPEDKDLEEVQPPTQ